MANNLIKLMFSPPLLIPIFYSYSKALISSLSMFLASYHLEPVSTSLTVSPLAAAIANLTAW